MRNKIIQFLAALVIYAALLSVYGFGQVGPVSGIQPVNKGGTGSATGSITSPTGSDLVFTGNSGAAVTIKQGANGYINIVPKLPAASGTETGMLNWYFTGNLPDDSTDNTYGWKQDISGVFTKAGHDARANNLYVTATGTQAGNQIALFTTRVVNNMTSGNISTMAGWSNTIRLTNAGTATNGYGFRTQFTLSSTGSVSGGAYGFQARTPSLTSSGTIATGYAFYAEAQKATGVTTGYAFYNAGVNDLNLFAGLSTFGSTKSLAAWGVTGPIIATAASTITDSSSSGTVASAAANSFAVPTFAASSATTFTQAANVYIAGDVAAGTNVTNTNSVGLWNVGKSRFDGSSVFNSSVSLNNGARISIGADGVAESVGDLGNTGTSFAVRSRNITNTTSSGTVAANAVSSFAINSLLASSATTYTDAATVYIDGPPVASTNVTITNAWGFWNVGKSRLDGSVVQAAKTTTYNNIVTAGQGLPAIYSAPAISATKTANFTVLTYTPPASAGQYRLSGVITTTSATNTGTVQFTVDYVDSQGTTHTADIIPLCDAAGVIATTKTGASKEFEMVPRSITVNNAATAIVIKVVITGSVSYTVAATVEQLN